MLWCCSLALLFGLHLYLLSPQKELLTHLDKKLSEKKLEYNSCKAAGSEEVRVRWNKQIVQFGERLSMFVADANDLDSLNFSISKIAGQMKVGAFSCRKTDGESYVEIPNYNIIGRTGTAVTFNGTFNKFARFVNVLERHRPVIFVKEFDISNSGKEDFNHRVNIVLSVFMKLPEQETEEK